MTAPSAAASVPPTNMPIHGVTPNRVKRTAEV